MSSSRPISHHPSKMASALSSPTSSANTTLSCSSASNSPALPHSEISPIEDSSPSPSHHHRHCPPYAHHSHPASTSRRVVVWDDDSEGESDPRLNRRTHLAPPPEVAAAATNRSNVALDIWLKTADTHRRLDGLMDGYGLDGSDRRAPRSMKTSVTNTLRFLRSLEMTSPELLQRNEHLFPSPYDTGVPRTSSSSTSAPSSSSNPSGARRL